MQTITSRRSILAGSAAACLVAVPVAAAPATATDAELLAAFSRWVRAKQHMQAITKVADDDTFEAACRRADLLEAEIASIPARTAEGVAAKFFVLLQCVHGGTRSDWSDVQFADCYGNELLALHESLFADARRLLPELRAAT